MPEAGKRKYNPKSRLNLRPVKKGEVRNPGGKNKIPEDLKKPLLLTKIQVLERLVKYLQMDVTSLAQILQDKSATVMDVWIARVCYLGIKEGDYKRLEFMFDRIIGKIGPDLHLTSNTYNFSQMPTEAVIDLGKSAIKYLEHTNDPSS